MAKFVIAYAATGAIEKGYANNRKDTGGETYNGIARRRIRNGRGGSVLMR